MTRLIYFQYYYVLAKAFWRTLAKEDLNRARHLNPNFNIAKNVILFVGDGMGVTTVTAARILKGQLQGRTGEEGLLNFERFPYIGLSKVYNQDYQTPDSAATATAFLSGVKTNRGVVGLDGRSRYRNCSTATGTEVSSMLDWSQSAGKSTGIVTNTRITHATPAAAYAHTPYRSWEGDVDIRDDNAEPCIDISKQLIDDNPNINVIMGGGRRTFLRADELDPETNSNSSDGRLDGRNLIDDWEQYQATNGRRYTYVWNQSGFDSVDPETNDYLLGLFNPSHMEYELDRGDDTGGEPSLAEMTEKAIRILRKNPKGYFLLVEGGRIDHAHHGTRAVKSLHETLAFDDAVQKAVDLTCESDTLIIVTADHSHPFSIGGYASRGNDIFGLVDDPAGGNQMALDGKPYTTIAYGNGPGSWVLDDTTRPDIANDITDADYEFQAVVPLYSETHSIEDVAIYAQGPMSHFFHGIHEQHYIAHVMAYAACVGDYRRSVKCDRARRRYLSSAWQTLGQRKRRRYR